MIVTHHYNNITPINKENIIMEVLAITQTSILTRLSCGKKALIPISDLSEGHPLIVDAMSFRLGYIAAINTLAANEQCDDGS